MAFFRGDFTSNELQMNTSINVIIPQGMNNNELNVVYLLHGLSDNCTGWTRLTSIERYANEHKVAIVMPEVQRSYYTDMKYGLNYFSYVSKELIQFVGSMFHLSTKRENTYVAGLSMGGYGAMKCAFSRPEQYAACAAFSAVCDINNTIKERMPAANLNELYAILGQELRIDNKDDLFYLSTKCNEACEKPRIFMTCGTSDMLYPQNKKLQAHLESLDFDYTFKEWEGNHTWDFWDTSVKMALEFFFGKPTSGTATPLSDGVEK
ncbi:alpha/beta hydrolase family protein [Paludicola sp. MB14-C6]|uniref:alpha/beta hydrolase n=1 Tax=Paludihabitans sp. MB14-C6 TaxID=3070656 RepID=UPI0027DDED82|nr:alpha/beta hydrolase family protein [Paludicola sp. MB14-C6]WMJ22074.1 alpha/beta hydrolase family protein [Paludicola sp. MB14-C6]